MDTACMQTLPVRDFSMETVTPFLLWKQLSTTEIRWEKFEEFLTLKSTPACIFVCIKCVCVCVRVCVKCVCVCVCARVHVCLYIHLRIENITHNITNWNLWQIVLLVKVQGITFTGTTIGILQWRIHTILNLTLSHPHNTSRLQMYCVYAYNTAQVQRRTYLNSHIWKNSLKSGHGTCVNHKYSSCVWKLKLKWVSRPLFQFFAMYNYASAGECNVVLGLYHTL